MTDTTMPDGSAAQQVIVSAGGSANINITLVGTPPRFDQFETSSELNIRDALWIWQRRDDSLALSVTR